MEVFGVDKNLKMLTANIPYFNLQWTRKYYSPGEFSIQIPASIYDDSWKYIMTHDRPEIGLIQKIEYSNENGEELIQISGFFAEKMLDSIVCDPRFTHDFSKTETTIHEMFKLYSVGTKKNITFVENPVLLGDRTESDFQGDQISKKMYSILQTRELSYKIYTNETFSGLFMQVWQGIDRTQGQTANSWAVFSTAWGNISSENVSIDSSAYANVCVVSADDEKLRFEVDQSKGGERFEIFLNKNSESKKEDQTDVEFKAALQQEAIEKLADSAIEETIDVSNFGAEGYLKNFDLGDKVILEIEKLSLNMETRIVEIKEVFKSSGHTVDIGFGTKRIIDLERALMRR